MSELKAFITREGFEAYLKYEADKVIAEKDKQLRHSNHKRCLAMAKWCEAELFTYPPFGTESPKEKWCQKWHKRWLELAEKFKEDK